MAEQDPQLGRRANVPTYEGDYAAWVTYQAELMKSDRWTELDRENVVDEFESLEREEFETFTLMVRDLIFEMLRWDIQEDNRCQHRAHSIAALREIISQELRDCPSYDERHAEAMEEAYRRASFDYSQRFKVPGRLFPEACPYAWNDLMSREHVGWEDAAPKLDIYKI